MAEWLIEPLADDHDRGAFSCGNPSLDVFLQKHAGQYSRKDIGKTFVAVRRNSRQVVGYYTLAASSLEVANLPASMAKRLPLHPVPMILLGRLAVDGSTRRQGLGKYLIQDAFSRILRIAAVVGVFAVHVHAADEAAASFYAKFGFQPIPDQERHMILPLTTIRLSIARSGKK